MVRVYLVVESDYDSFEVHGVFATKEAAKAYIDGDEYLTRRRDYVDIDDWEVKG